jgi:hypothetical protein
VLGGLRLPDTVSNPVSLAGIAVATAAAAVFLVLLLLELFELLVNPYLGLLIFVTVPLVFLAGLALVPVGAWWAARRRRLRPEAPEWPVVDLNRPRQRAWAVLVVALTFVNVVIVSLAAYGGVHYMESDEFCGQVCHTTMEPEFVAHQVGAHARVSCTACHVGPGVGSFVEAKLAGTRQLYHLMTGQVPRPVPTPVRSLGRTSDTCEGCHLPGRFYGDVAMAIREYADDEDVTEYVTGLRLHLGGPDAGIHRHVGLDIEYVTTDEVRETIPLVRVRAADGGIREFRADGASDEAIAAGTLRQMDCLDCHSRPAHAMSPSAARAVDAANARDEIPRELPFVRREVVAAVGAEYPDRATALATIATRLRAFYAERPDVEPPAVLRAVVAAQDVWARNVFPRMQVTWGTYVSHLGHVDSPGCFRCHDDGHRTPDGATISQDCELCHAFE